MIERLAYDPSFDRRDFKMVQGNKEALEKQALYTKTQLETHLGERFNVLLNTTNYQVKDGTIYGQNMDEPFLDVIKRGVISEREQSELKGFIKLQDFFANNASDGDMMLSVSPPGGEYQHNFYDIFTLKKDPNGNFIEARRYSSALSIEEYEAKLKPHKTFQNKPKDTDFLSEPIIINRGLLENADDVHKFLHKDHEYTEREDFEAVLKAVSPIITSLINSLAEDPSNVFEHGVHFDAIYNKADFALQVKKQGNEKLFNGLMLSSAFFRKDELYYYAQQPVRKINTPCGASSGFSESLAQDSISSPWRVSDKISDGNPSSLMSDADKAKADKNLCKCGGESPHFHCPGETKDGKCDNKIVVGKGISVCPKCGEGKKC